MSGNSNQRGRFGAGKSNSRTNRTKVGSKMEWKPKPKIANDGSLDNTCCNSKDNPPLPVDCTPKPMMDIPFRQDSALPVVKDVTSDIKNLNLTTNTCCWAHYDSSHLGSVIDNGSSLLGSLADNGSSHLGSVADSGSSHLVSVADSGLSDMGSVADSGSSHLGSVADCSSNHLGSEAHHGLSHLGSVADGGSSHLGSVADSASNHLGSEARHGLTPLGSVADGGSDHLGSVADSGSNHLRSALTSDNSSRLDNTGHPSLTIPYDICPNRSHVVKLKAPLHVKNKEKRKQIKQFANGPNIIVLRPGMVLMKAYISIDDQVSIVKACRDLGMGKGGFYQPGYRDGATLHLKMMCLGKNWDPQSSNYSDTRPLDNTKPPPIPESFHHLVKKAIQDSNDHIADARKSIPFMLPDICIINFYTKGGKLGLHQDKDESGESIDKGLPVVSFSIGESAEFLYGESRDVEKASKVVLESGDVLIFGGVSRRIFHGVTSILPDTAPTSLLEATDLRSGRLNLTFRQF